MEENTKVRKQNMKIYSLYRAISCDLIFFYAIEFLFLTQVKNISASEVVLKGAFYSIFMIIFQIPASIIIDKLGTRRCTIFGNVLNALYIVLIMIAENLEVLIFAEFVSALCFSIKDISDRALIQFSIPKTKKQGEIFSKLEGKGIKNYYLLNAITYACSGFLYVINPYIPIIGSLFFALLATVMSLGFQEIEERKEKQEPKKYMTDLGEGVSFIIKSQRLRSLFLYGGISWGIFCLMGTYRSSLLVDIGTPEQMITIIVAIVSISASVGSKRQLQFHQYFRNKALSAVLIITTVSILIAGLVGIINISYSVSLIMITICFIIIDFAKGIGEVLVSRYLGNFMNEKILTQIYAVNAISRNLMRAAISFLGSYLLGITNTANSMIIIGIILLMTSLCLIMYMKTRLGLKPEEYSKNEIWDN